MVIKNIKQLSHDELIKLAADNNAAVQNSKIRNDVARYYSLLARKEVECRLTELNEVITMSEDVVNVITPLEEKRRQIKAERKNAEVKHPKRKAVSYALPKDYCRKAEIEKVQTELLSKRWVRDVRILMPNVLGVRLYKVSNRPRVRTFVPDNIEILFYSEEA